jgi:hypothetical protein
MQHDASDAGRRPTPRDGNGGAGEAGAAPGSVGAGDPAIGKLPSGASMRPA